MARHTQPTGTFLRIMQPLLPLILAAFWLSSAATCWAAPNAESVRYYEDAKAYLKKGDVNAAAIQLKNAIRADESNVEARFDLAAIHLSRSDGASAEKELRTALVHGMPRERLLIPLAQALILQNKSEVLLKETDAGSLRGHEAGAVVAGVAAYEHTAARPYGICGDDCDPADAVETGNLGLPPPT